MQFLAFRKKSTGKWTNALFTTADDSFDAKQTASRRKDIAAALGIRVTDLEAVSGATDPRSGTYLALPVAPPSAQQVAREQAYKDIEANKDTPWGRVLRLLAVADGRIEA